MYKGSSPFLVIRLLDFDILSYYRVKVKNVPGVKGYYSFLLNSTGELLQLRDTIFLILGGKIDYPFLNNCLSYLLLEKLLMRYPRINDIFEETEIIFDLQMDFIVRIQYFQKNPTELYLRLEQFKKFNAYWPFKLMK